MGKDTGHSLRNGIMSSCLSWFAGHQGGDLLQARQRGVLGPALAAQTGCGAGESDRVLQRPARLKPTVDDASLEHGSRAAGISHVADFIGFDAERRAIRAHNEHRPQAIGDDDQACALLLQGERVIVLVRAGEIELEQSARDDNRVAQIGRASCRERV